MLAGIGLIVVLFLPLLVNELQTGFQETRLILDYVRGGDAPLSGGPVSALAFTLLRITGWPLMGLVTDVPALAALLLALVIAYLFQPNPAEQQITGGFAVFMADLLAYAQSQRN